MRTYQPANDIQTVAAEDELKRNPDRDPDEVLREFAEEVGTSRSPHWTAGKIG